MKRKVGIILALAMVLSALTVSTGFAAPWYTCNVVASGTSGANTLIMLTDVTTSPGAFTNRWFVLNGTYAKQLLATSLTGSASSLRVYAYLPNPASGQTISNLYVVSDNF